MNEKGNHYPVPDKRTSAGGGGREGEGLGICEETRKIGRRGRRSKRRKKGWGEEKEEEGEGRLRGGGGRASEEGEGVRGEAKSKKRRRRRRRPDCRHITASVGTGQLQLVVFAQVNTASHFMTRFHVLEALGGEGGTSWG